ncbi:hypothetical protein CHS0354_018911 [Potamilus streckersoni]|uniref:RHD domain-containing protein n=1 Tax=Potamilus streckersoni TaxID=2493646 RepID=A0AAE0RMZ4_9BIVA|nr:hypothetical protein CHS0354_018911 [Potamilus streckersoni]
MDLQNQDNHEILNDLLQSFQSVCQNDSVLAHQQGDTGHTSTTAMKNPHSQDPFLNGQETASTLAPQILIIPPLSTSDIDMNKPPDLDIHMSTQDYSIHRDSHVGTTSSPFFPVVSSVNDLFPSVTLGNIISSTGIEFNSIVASTVVDSFISSPTPTTCTASTFGNTSRTHELSDVTSCAEPLHIHVDKPSSMLEKLLTGNHGISDANMTGSNSSASMSSPDTQVNSPSPVSSSNNSPFTNFDTNTQSTMIEKAERLHLDSDSFIGTIDDISSDILIGWNEMSSINNVAPKSAKVQKCDENIDAPTALLSQQPSVEKVFDVGEAVSSSEFIFAKFGAEHISDNLFKFGHNRPNSTGSVTSPRVGLPISDFVNEQPVEPPQSRSRTNHNGMSSRASSQRRATKEPILNQQFPSKVCNYELKMLDQPEEQHRARYLTEGSRGAVKNRSQQGNPVVKLFGHNEPAVVQIFVGNDTGKTRPHGFYQACKVCGKNSTPCNDKDIDGTTVIEVDLKPSNDMTAIIDCVGILKLRNADVEQRIGIAKAKKKSTKARLIFRTTFQKPDGSSITLQVASSTILCTQPAGQPEICKMSIRETLMSGGDELFIIGKNFLKGAKVIFQQPGDGEDGGFKWEEEGEIDKDYFQPTHIVCKVPPYSEPVSTGPVVVNVVVSSGGKVSDPQPFTYKPEVTVKQEIPMETDQQGGVKRNFSFVAPEALELNQQIQNSQNSDAMFQLPPGSIPAISRIDSPPTPMDESHHSQHSRKSSFSSQVQSNDSPNHDYFNPPSHEQPSPASSTDIPHNSQTPLPSPFHSPQSIVNSPKDGINDQHGIQQCLMQAMTNGGQQSVQLQQHPEQIQHVQHFQQQHVQQQQHMQHLQHHMNTQQHIHQQAQMQQQQFQSHVEQLQQQQQQQEQQQLQHQSMQMPGYQIGSPLVQIQPTVTSPPSFHQQQQQQQAQQSGVGLLQQYNGLVPGSLQDDNNSLSNIQNSFSNAMFNGQAHANPSIIPKHETTGSSVLSAVTMATLASSSSGPQIIICPAGSTGLPGTMPNSMPAPPSIVIMPGSGPNSNTSRAYLTSYMIYTG